MRIGFDLDGTLDRPALAELAKSLLADGHEVHIITGVFDEAGDWQNGAAKYVKLVGLGIQCHEYPAVRQHGTAMLHVLHAVDVSFGLEYRLRDLGLRKGALCHKFGITMFFDDSETYCEMLPKMSGSTQVLHVR